MVPDSERLREKLMCKAFAKEREKPVFRVSAVVQLRTKTHGVMSVAKLLAKLLPSNLFDSLSSLVVELLPSLLAATYSMINM